ncbi:MAG: hypothetical protein FJ086_06355 [Deltaproteobacteria bacterium]|nr:hypothetical protein [Deltaproteobacteria bacterium]
MDPRDQARALARRLQALGGGAEVVRRAAARELAALHPGEATELLRQLMAISREGLPDAAAGLQAVLAALQLDGDVIPFAPQLLRLARLQELEEVEALFVDAPARQEMDLDAARRADALAFSDTLGHLKTKARITRDPDLLSRLVHVSHPDVVRNALLNARLTEPLVVGVAAKRPCRPEPLLEIYRSPRWGVRHAVRRALAFNPYLPPAVGAKLVPLLNDVDLRELVVDLQVHENLRRQAELLLAGPALQPLRVPQDRTLH